MHIVLFIILSFLPFSDTNNNVPEELFQLWYHSHEESHDEIRYYRPETYEFPPARAREAIEFRKDGSFSEFRTGPADGWIEYKGKFKKKKCGTFEITLQEPTKENFSFNLISVSDKLLKIKIVK